jgi:integrase core domain protein
MDKIISNGVSKGQSFYHFMHSNDLVVSTSFLYRYVKSEYFSIDSVDCKRIVKFRKRKKVNNEGIPKHLKLGRYYINFLDFMNDSRLPFHLEMDTVIGKRGCKTLLAFNTSSCNFMFTLLLDSNASNKVSSKLYKLKEKLYQNNVHFSMVVNFLMLKKSNMILIKTYNYFSAILILLEKKVR